MGWASSATATGCSTGLRHDRRRADPTLAGLAASGVLILVAVVLSLVQHLGMHRSIVWASVQALVQLLAIGVVLGQADGAARTA